MRLAVQDLRGSTLRKRAVRLGRPELWTLYTELLWALHEAGGTLSSDPHALADELEFWTPEEIAEMLPLIAPTKGKRGGIVIDGAVLRNARVDDGLEEAAAFGATQSARANKRWDSQRNATASSPMPSQAVAVSVAVASAVAKPEPAASPAGVPADGTVLAPITFDPARVVVSQRGEYAKAVWEAWVKRRGGTSEIADSTPSPQEWHLAAHWFDEQVPLRIVLRGIADCGGKPGPRTSLAYAEGAVRDAAKRYSASKTA